MITTGLWTGSILIARNSSPTNGCTHLAAIKNRVRYTKKGETSFSTHLPIRKASLCLVLNRGRAGVNLGVWASAPRLPQA